MNRFKVTRIGLLNFWLYDEEEYDFYGGKLILRGINGSGKSVTMQSFIPLILDGNKNPDRLDPFGSKERKIEDYILGDSDSIQKEEAISYLYMETYNEEENRYITVGLGFRGRKGKPIESWGFALIDGKRVKYDFYLYKDPVNKIPLTKNELKSRLGDINLFTDTTKDYKAMVNRLLFGFPDLDVYDEFIKLLLQLRSNKLSKEFKPTNLISVLNTVLQPLSPLDLRPLSEAIENMNNTKEQIEVLEGNLKKLNDFLRVYKNYNEAVLLEKARNCKYYNDEYISENKNYNNSLKELEDLKNDFNTKSFKYNKVIEEIEINEEEKRQLDNKDLKEKIESLSKINENISNLEKKINEIVISIDKNKENELDISKDISDLSNEIYVLKKEIIDECTTLKDMKDDSYFDEIVFFMDELIENLDKEFSFDSLFMSLKSYINKINSLILIFEEQEKLNSESEIIRVEKNKLERNYSILEKDIRNNENKKQESIKFWEENFINVINNNKYLKIASEDKKKIFDYIVDYSKENFQNIVNIYKETSRDLINDSISKNLVLNNKKGLKLENLSSLKDEYDKVNSSDTLEIPSNVDTDILLDNNNIKNIALYKCIEFKKDIDDNFKNKLEASLYSSNILNARIISEEDKERVNKLGAEVMYLTKTTKKKNSLIKYFDVNLNDDLFSKEYVGSILECISISEEDIFSILPDGISKMDTLTVVSDSNYKQTYIGYLKRIELKNKKLKELEDSINSIKSEITNLENLIKDNELKISIIKNEEEKLPLDSEIEIIENVIKELNIQLLYNDSRQKELEISLKEYDNKLKDLQNTIVEQSKGVHVPLNLKQYKIVSNVCVGMKDSLQNLKNSHLIYVNKVETNNICNERLEEVRDRIADLLADENEKSRELNVNIASRDKINEILNTKEYKDQKERLITIQENLVRLLDEREALVKETTRLDEKIKNKMDNIEQIKSSLSIKENKSDIYREIFVREYNLLYVYSSSDKDTIDKVNDVIKDYGNKKNISVNETLQNFWAMYNKYNLDLSDYSFRNVTLFSDYEEEDQDIQKIYESNIRIDVQVMYQGVSVTIYELAQRLGNDIEEGKLLVNEDERKLFEDILINTVGTKIRERIEASNLWVEKINSIMNEMQVNSALGFKLVWKNMSASEEGELDTREIVRILKMEPNLLKSEDSIKLGNHFRSKIKKAEEIYKESYVSFYKIIEEILDYRNWFTFQLMYQRIGDNLKELTDKVFSKFSGGERAKSMYIPLFASVYAKFNMARSDALRIIALDEAFAGVDEDNIREMFGILKFLDIDFIINSQVLWGDYDTIPDLSICELIRPQNSKVVTVERYRWNGKFKEVILDRKEYNERLEDEGIH